MNKQVREFYLDWFNNYLTIEKMAEHHDLDVEHARTLIVIGRDAHLQYIEAQHQDNLKKNKYYYEWARLRRDYPAIECTK